MNRETIATLHDIKQAILQQQTLTMREIRARLAASEAERDALLDALNRAGGDETVATAITATRYRAFQKKALVRIGETIDAITCEHREAEDDLTATFAEVRAIERLMLR